MGNNRILYLVESSVPPVLAGHYRILDRQGVWPLAWGDTKDPYRP